ncbi:MAG: archaemetzincin [Desulfobacteraceae bacterium]|nr:archaemetzincin [Desulfobacteraceae bacterium]
MNPEAMILISPVGKIPDWINMAVAETVESLFRFRTRVVPLLTDLYFAYDEKRDQYFSTAILGELEKKLPLDCIKVLALTREDLFIPILTHVYGEAQLGGRAAVVSILRLMEYPGAGDLKKSRERIVKEAAHELGHAFDLRHCEDPGCIMHYCRKLEDVDHKSDQFCRYCKVLLSDAVRALGR